MMKKVSTEFGGTHTILLKSLTSPHFLLVQGISSCARRGKNTQVGGVIYPNKKRTPLTLEQILY